MHPLVKQIEALFVPELKSLASQLSQQLPSLTFNVWHSPTGTLTEYQGYDAGLECMFPSAAKDIPNNVALSISLCHLMSAPKLMASVEWGHPCGRAIAERQGLRDNSGWEDATQEKIDELKQTFPTLVQAFVSEVHNGTPAASSAKLA